MHSKLLHNADGQRTFAVILAAGDEVMASLKDFVTREKIAAAQFSAIGAPSDVVLEYFDSEKKAYTEIPLREQVEVASLLGDVAEADGTPAIHLHIVVGRRDGSVMAAHAGAAQVVRPTLEIILTESPAHLRRPH